MKNAPKTLLALIALLIVLVSCVNRSGSNRTSTSSPPPNQTDTTPAGNTTSTNPLLERPVLKATDFEYLGSFAPPKAAINNPQGGKWSTGYGFGGLALRRVNGELRFLATTHVYSGGQVYEMRFPGLSKQAGQYPQAEIVREWGDVYTGRKALLEKSGSDECGARNNALSSGSWTHGLYWDEPSQRLYWSYGNWYNGGHCNNPALGFSTLEPTGPRASGPWTSEAAKGGAHAQMIRGGVLRIPAWFANEFTAGRSFGLGFGGYYSIIAEGSQGPSLFATTDPDPNTPKLETLPLLNFPGSQKARRNPDYALGRNADGNTHPSWDREPENGVGYFTAADTIEGAAIWIDTPSKHGLMFFPRLGHGRVGYNAGAVTWQQQKQWWYIYNPKDLAAVAQGKRQPWQVEPAVTSEADFALTATDMRITGAAFDASENTLYLYVYQAYQDGFERYPLVRAYKLKH